MKTIKFIVLFLLTATIALACNKGMSDAGNSSIIADTSRFSIPENLDSMRLIFRGIAFNDEGGSQALYNPERGFRLEIQSEPMYGTDLWYPAKYPTITAFLEEEDTFYKEDSVSLVQSYFYLNNFLGTDIAPQAFSNMNIYFTKLRSMGKKAVLRFAYEKAMGTDAGVGPVLEDILRHMEQLKPLLEQNKDVIHVFQAGFIGAWGEWHSSFHGLENSTEVKRKVAEKVLWMTPANRFAQFRLPEFKNLNPVNSDAYKRTGFHDDFITVVASGGDGNIRPGETPYIQIANESPFVPVDGELPWGAWSMASPGHIVDGVGTAKRLFEHHYNSLSIAHNYKETSQLPLGKYSMKFWKETNIPKQFLIDNKMPISSGYFENTDGTPVNRNVFDYIRDHLGYRIELQDFKSKILIGDTPKTFKFDLTLINRGFSTVFNQHTVSFVLIDQSNNIHELPTTVSVNDWQPYDPADPNYTPLVHRVEKEVDLRNLPSGDYRLGLWISDDAADLKYNHRYAIRCANGDIKWWVSADKKYGVNILSLISI